MTWNDRLGAGVEFFVDGAEAVLVDVGVDLGGGDVGVAEHFLDNAEVGAVIEEVGGKAVAELVGMDFLGEACGGGAFVDDLFDA